MTQMVFDSYDAQQDAYRDNLAWFAARENRALSARYALGGPTVLDRIRSALTYEPQTHAALFSAARCSPAAAYRALDRLIEVGGVVRTSRPAGRGKGVLLYALRPGVAA